MVPLLAAPCWPCKVSGIARTVLPYHKEWLRIIKVNYSVAYHHIMHCLPPGLVQCNRDNENNERVLSLLPAIKAAMEEDVDACSVDVFTTQPQPQLQLDSSNETLMELVNMDNSVPVAGKFQQPQWEG